MQLFVRVHKYMHKFCGLLKLFDEMFCNAHCIFAALLCVLMLTEGIHIYERTHTP